MTRVAVIYTLDSAPTAIVAEIARHASNILREYDLDLKEFGVLKATRGLLKLYMLFRKFDGIFYFGHGWKTELVGQLPFGYIAPLIKVGDKPKTRLIYAVACLAGQELAPDLVNRGVVKSAIMNTSYTYVALPSNEHNYLEDFIDIFTSPIRVLADGGTTQEAYGALMSKIHYYMDMYSRNMDKWLDADFYYYALQHNSSYRLYGDPYARLYD